MVSQVRVCNSWDKSCNLRTKMNFEGLFVTCLRPKLWVKAFKALCVAKYIIMGTGLQSCFSFCSWTAQCLAWSMLAEAAVRDCESIRPGVVTWKNDSKTTSRLARVTPTSNAGDSFHIQTHKAGLRAHRETQMEEKRSRKADFSAVRQNQCHTKGSFLSGWDLIGKDIICLQLWKP